MRRREFVSILGGTAAAWPLAARAQQPVKAPRIGFLGATSYFGIASRVEALRAGLRDLGYVEGNNLSIDFRWAEGKYERLPGLAAELVRLKVDVLVTQGTPATFAAKQATATIPIVMGSIGDAVATGLVISLARPGGNITGSSFFAPELDAKRLELLKEARPRAVELAYLITSKKSAEMAGAAIDRIDDVAASAEDRARRKRRLIKGPTEFRELRGKKPKADNKD